MSGQQPAAARQVRVELPRLLERLQQLGAVGALPGGGVCRLALTDDDRRGRDLVVGWMRELGMQVSVDGIGNVVATRPGREALPAVMTGSHIDTVRTGGLYDGNLGVLAGLEVVAALNDAGVTTRRPLQVAFFTNEEGARFAPDMMGSLVFQGDLDLDAALATVGIDGETVGACLERIGYRGSAPVGAAAHDLHAYVELHIEQGPVLDLEGYTIGAVEGVQGISWTEFSVEGVSNHAGTTPMRLRHDAFYVAAELVAFARRLALEFGGDQVATGGFVEVKPNLVNVIPNRVRFTIDLRNTDEALLVEAERRVHAEFDRLLAAEGVRGERRSLARFAPVAFAPELVELVEAKARQRGHRVRRLPSGAGHDAQIIARMCPAAMVFVPSAGGISHNIREHTEAADLAAGAEVLLDTLLDLLD
ncbi:MAG TPA: M20 family metallo-hydrolase [Gammaproteobacteria bacterium]